MKRWSLGLTVLLLGVAPVAAMAADYGPDCQLLAANNDTGQLSAAAQATAASTDALTKPGTMAAGTDDVPDASPLAPHVPPSASAPASSALRSHGPIPMTSSKPRDSAPNKPTVEPGPATWQSLLPGSIQ